jgi:hypothetical protein
MGEPLTPSHFRVMVKLSRTLNPGGIDLAGGLRVQEEDSVVRGVEHHPFTVLPGDESALVVLQSYGDGGVGREVGCLTVLGEAGRDTPQTRD